MFEALTALIALQALDSAADTARRFISEMPERERALEAEVAAAQAVVDDAAARLKENEAAVRVHEKDVAAIDARMAKFEDHKAAVKTNQEFHALNHEIEVAQTGKTELEDQILALMEAAEALKASLKDAEATLAERRRTADAERARLHKDAAAHEADVARLAAERSTATQSIPADLLTKYDQISRSRKGVAVAPMIGGHCTACYVRLRPHAEQQVRRNDSIQPCDSCQRILYFVPPADTDSEPPAAPPAS